MSEKEYTFNGRIWRPQPTVSDANSFFHAILGEGEPCFDKDAIFRRRCLLNLLKYFETTSKPDTLQRWLEETLHSRESDEDYPTRYRALADRLSSSRQSVRLKEIAIIASLENIVIVVFTEGKEVPEIFNPVENFLGDYPWKIKAEVKETVICLRENNYTNLRLYRYEAPPFNLSLEESLEGVVEEVKEKDKFSSTRKYYSKLRGSAGIRGSLYQISLLTIYLLNASKNYREFRLSTENKSAGKFDDVVLEVPSDKGDITEGFLLQAKHRQNKKVTYDDLYQTNSNKDEFSLPMYYLSYQRIKNTFDVQKISLCTNTDLKIPKGCNAVEIHEGLLEQTDPLYFKNMKHCCYTFDESIIPSLIEKSKEYKENNLKDQTFDDSVLGYDQVKVFLSKFQLIIGYPTEGDLDVVIEEALCTNGYCNQYETKDCSKFINNKMMEWFEQNQGKYLTQDTLKIFLSEFRSTKFCEKLRNVQMHVKGNSLYYSREKRLLRIKFRRGYILNMIQAYCALYATERKCLFLNPNEDVATQIEMVRAFGWSEYDTLVACFGTSSFVSIEEISNTITDILKTHTWKRVVLITSTSDQLAELLKDKNNYTYEEDYENITFNDLLPESQTRLLKRAIQFFHISI